MARSINMPVSIDGAMIDDSDQAQTLRSAQDAFLTRLYQESASSKGSDITHFNLCTEGVQQIKNTPEDKPLPLVIADVLALSRGFDAWLSNPNSGIMPTPHIMEYHYDLLEVMRTTK